MYIIGCPPSIPMVSIFVPDSFLFSPFVKKNACHSWDCRLSVILSASEESLAEQDSVILNRRFSVILSASEESLEEQDSVILRRRFSVILSASEESLAE